MIEKIQPPKVERGAKVMINDIRFLDQYDGRLDEKTAYRVLALGMSVDAGEYAYIAPAAETTDIMLDAFKPGMEGAKPFEKVETIPARFLRVIADA
jgi:hypothetical protein